MKRRRGTFGYSVSGPSSSMGCFLCRKQDVLRAFKKWVRHSSTHEEFKAYRILKPYSITGEEIPIVTTGIVKTPNGELTSTGALIC